MEADKRKLVDQVTDARNGQELAQSELVRITRLMVELTSKADKDQALFEQEIEHFKSSDSELRRRETELSE